MKKQIEEQEYLTPEQFVQLKLSETIPFVIEDVERFTKKLGIKLHMDDYAVVEDDKLCSVCLGGAAVLGFYNGELSEVVKDALKYVYILMPHEVDGGKYDKEFRKIERTFDDIRACDYVLAFERWHDHEILLPDKLIHALETIRQKHTGFCGSMNESKKRRLYAQMREFASILARHGY